nr:hypothetical protein [Kofleriaceae bacterium]
MQRSGLQCVIFLAGLAASDAAAHAGTGRRSLHPPSRLKASNPHWIDISIRGLIATGVTHITFDNAHAAAPAASHRFNLPRDARVTAFKVGVGAPNAPLRITEEFEMADGSQAIRPGQKLRPDIAVLDAVHADTTWSTIGLSLAAQPRGASVTVEIVWQAPVTMRDHELRLTLPPGTTPGFRPPVTIHTDSAALDAAVIATTFGGETVESARARFAATAASQATQELELAIALRFRDDKPHVVHHRQPAGGCMAHSVNVVWPTPNEVHAMAVAVTTPRRMLLVVDGSKSMDAIGRAPVLTLVDHVMTQLAAIAPTAQVQALVFDRNAAWVLPAWSSNNRATQHVLLNALRSRVANNGSDPSAAAALAAKELQLALAHDKSPIDIVWITDGAYNPATDAIVAPLLNVQQLPPHSLRFHTLVVNQYQRTDGRSSTNTQVGVAKLTAVKKVWGGTVHHVSLGMLSDDRGSSAVVAIAKQVAIGGVWTDFTGNPQLPTVFSNAERTLTPGTAPAIAQYWSCPKFGQRSRIDSARAAAHARLDDVVAVLPEKFISAPIAALVGADAPIVQLPASQSDLGDARLLAQQDHLRRHITLASSEHVLVALDTSTAAGRQRARALRAGMPYVQLTADQPLSNHAAK